MVERLENSKKVEECVDCPNTCNGNGTKENPIKTQGNILNVKRVKEGIIALIIAILDVIFMKLIVPKKMGNVIVKMVILEKHAMKNAIKIVIRMMIYAMIENQNIILTQMIKSNALIVLRIAWRISYGKM